MSIKSEYEIIVKRLEYENKNHLTEVPNYEDISLAIKPEIELFSRNLQENE